ncbi:MAG: SDR family NAD(P)-dependent oxidoreductase [Actinomycetota bacterium]|nr:SDR family NAD(P)-dependent oxidoreductase [Actinomycetota bacterium]
MSRFEGANVLVVGGGADGPPRPGETLAMGNGRAMALRLAAEGARVAVTDIDGDLAAGTVDALATDGLAIVADAADPDQCRAAVERAERELGPLTGVVCNVGIGSRTPIDDLTVEEWDRIFSINVTSHWVTAQAALAHMVPRGRGAFVFVSSGTALRSPGFALAYESSNLALHAVARHVAVRHGCNGIRANVVSPGLIESAMARRAWGDLSFRDAVAPMRRQGQPEELAAVVAFYLSDDAAYVSGTVLPVDGGIDAGNYNEHRPELSRPRPAPAAGG